MQRMPMTRPGYERIKAELKTTERTAVANEIEIARAHGDLRENADYDAAKEKQGMLEARIRDLEDAVGRAQVIDISNLSGDKVVFGATVTLLDLNTDQEQTLTLVGEVETDLKAGRISVTAPLARALVGRSVDDEVKVRTPGGLREYEITDVQFN